MLIWKQISVAGKVKWHSHDIQQQTNLCSYCWGWEVGGGVLSSNFGWSTEKSHFFPYDFAHDCSQLLPIRLSSPTCSINMTACD